MVPVAIGPRFFQCAQMAQALHRPELAGPFAPALPLATGRLYCPTTNRPALRRDPIVVGPRFMPGEVILFAPHDRARVAPAAVSAPRSRPIPLALSPAAADAIAARPTPPLPYRPHRARPGPTPRDVGWRGRNPTLPLLRASDPPPCSRSTAHRRPPPECDGRAPSRPAGLPNAAAVRTPTARPAN